MEYAAYNPGAPSAQPVYPLPPSRSPIHVVKQKDIYGDVYEGAYAPLWQQVAP